MRALQAPSSIITEPRLSIVSSHCFLALTFFLLGINNVPISSFSKISFRMLSSNPLAITVYVFESDALLTACILVMNPPIPVSLSV